MILRYTRIFQHVPQWSTKDDESLQNRQLTSSSSILGSKYRIFGGGTRERINSQQLSHKTTDVKFDIQIGSDWPQMG